jgi:hypothetical protein
MYVSPLSREKQEYFPVDPTISSITIVLLTTKGKSPDEIVDAKIHRVRKALPARESFE